MGRKILILSVALVLVFSLYGCSSSMQPESSEEAAASIAPTESSAKPTADNTESIPQSPVVPEQEIELVAKTLRGECYDDQPDDKREVVKVICNRVSNGGFGGSIEAVITAPGQFHGYRPGNVPTANDYAVAREVLEQWYANGCAPLGEYLFFSSGSDHKNIFRRDWKEG